MARQSGLSVSTVQRIWRAFGLKPHRHETFKLSTDPDFVAKVRDVVGLYLSPPEHALVLSVDEKSQIQALDRSQAVFPMRPGQARRGSHDYVRHGTTSLFACRVASRNSVTGCLNENVTRRGISDRVSRFGRAQFLRPGYDLSRCRAAGVNAGHRPPPQAARSGVEPDEHGGNLS